MIVYHNLDDDKTLAFFPCEKEGEFTVISPDGTAPSEISPDTMKTLSLFAESKNIKTEEDLKRFQEKLEAAFPKGENQNGVTTADEEETKWWETP